MSFISFICPFLYAMILGSAWSIWFRKPFYSSLAPAFFLHILAVMISGMLFKRLSVGIFGAIVLAIVILVCCMVRKNKSLSPVDLKAYGKEIWDNGGAVFAIFYVLCFILNANKSFIHWDEFSHWGPFLKESLRLDQLYCMSPMDFAHKDYVPAVTIFEAIWCRLGFRYTEPDAYRAIQVLMFSMFLPVFEKFHSYAYEQSGGNRSGNNGSMKKIIKYRLLQVGAVLLVLMVPLIFHTGLGFCFYHSICCDVVFGVMFYWCLYEAYRDHEVFSYQSIVMGTGISVFVLCKMTAMALFPVVVVLLFVNALFFSQHKPRAKEW